MLRFFLTDKNGGEKELGQVLTVELDRDIRVPADSLTLTCLYDGDIRENAVAVKAYRDELLLFSGQLDDIAVIKQAGGVILRLSARSLAAGLLDNEAEPLTYNNPTDGLIESRHLAPFGIRLSKRDNIPCYDALKINKGASHWQVLLQFCRSRYGCEPRITGDGRAVLDGAREEGTAVFSDRGAGIPYCILKENNRRYRLLSQVRLKYLQAAGYGSVLRNTNPEAAFVDRVRYVNAAADKTTLETARQMLRTANQKSYTLRLCCVGCRADVFAKAAVVEDSVLGRLEGLYAEKIRYTANSRGERTEITLNKEWNECG